MIDTIVWYLLHNSIAQDMAFLPIMLIMHKLGWAKIELYIPKKYRDDSDPYALEVIS